MYIIFICHNIFYVYIFIFLYHYIWYIWFIYIFIIYIFIIITFSSYMFLHDIYIFFPFKKFFPSFLNIFIISWLLTAYICSYVKRRMQIKKFKYLLRHECFGLLIETVDINDITDKTNIIARCQKKNAIILIMQFLIFFDICISNICIFLIYKHMYFVCILYF